MASKTYLLDIYLQLHNQGVPFDQIAEHLGMTAQGLQRLIDETITKPDVE